METKQAILDRRSVREYLNEPVSEEDLREVLEAALWAPSAVNLQPWYFVAIRDPDKLKLLGQVMERVSQDIEPTLRERFARHPAVVDETTAFVRRLGGAPVCVLVFAYRPEYKKTDQTIYESIGAAIENLLLAAVDKGLASCWLTAPVETGKSDELRDLFAPGKGPLAAMVTLGHPKRTPPAPPRRDGRYTIV